MLVSFILFLIYLIIDKDVDKDIKGGVEDKIVVKDVIKPGKQHIIGFFKLLTAISINMVGPSDESKPSHGFILVRHLLSHKFLVLPIYKVLPCARAW